MIEKAIDISQQADSTSVSIWAESHSAQPEH